MNKSIKILAFLYLLITSFTPLHSDAPPCPFIESVNVITGQYSEFHTDLILGGPRPLTVQRAFYGSADGEEEDTLAWRFNHHGLFNQTVHPLEDAVSLDSLLIEERDSLERPTKVAIQNPTGTKTFNWLNIAYEEGTPNSCRIEGSDGRTVSYTYSHDPITTRNYPNLLLEKIIDGNGIETGYTYKQHPTKRKMLISRREGADGRYIEVDYYNGQHNYVAGEVISLNDPMNDPRIGNVKVLKAPVGTNEDAVITHSFIYNKDHTIVFDADHNKTVYRYNENACITAIETYLIESGQNHSLYRKELFFWSEPTETLPPKFIGRAITDASDKIYSYTAYRYDERGNLIEETVYGNLTGECDIPIHLDGTCTERATTCYEYKEGSSLLTKKSDPSGLTTRYEYEPETGRQTAHFLCNGDAIMIRQFYLYNDDGLLITTISDDGNGESIDNLSGVTERHIVRLTLREEAPALGMPEVIEEYVLDGGESLQKRTINYYANNGKLTRQECYDADGALAATIERDYDSFGRCIFSSKANGASTTNQYDSNGNIIETIERDTAGKSRTIHNHYDLSNRLIRTEETTETGSTISSSFRYNTLSQKIASIDSYGNETTYNYDPLGRLTRLSHPEVRTDDNTWIHPTVTNTYDVAGNIISTIDPKGYQTISNYNSRGMPIEVLYPDGTREKYVYHLDGTIHKHYAKNGILTVTQHDFLGRTTSTEQYAADGTHLNTITHTYSAFHLLHTHDSRGIDTTYEYDAAGRQSAIVHTTADSSTRTEFLYDAQGRLSGQKEWFGNGEMDYTISRIERDTDGTIIETRVEDANGQLLRYKKTDEQIPQARALTRDMVAHNDHHQQTPQEVTTDDKGITTVTTLDALGRIEKQSKIDPMGHLISETEYLYDAAGNKIRETHTTSRDSPYIISWKYGPCHRLEEMIEGVGSPQQRTTTYGYDKYGVLNKITHPKGVTISYLYDGAGRLKELSSSDRTCYYSYDYDTMGNIHSIYDHINNTTTTRQYDSTGNMLTEQLGNGLAITKHYNGKRPVQLILPDNSSITYDYDTLNLSTITRLSSSSEPLYEHCYGEYDLEGKPHLSGTVRYNFDEKGRITAITSPHWQQTISYNNQGAATVVTKDPEGTTTSTLSYNSAGQLVKEGDDNYVYDAINNRISHNNSSYTVGPCNELLNDGTTTFRYDANGNMIELSNANCHRTLRYDALNRLISISEDKAWSLSFTYDAFNRRLTKQTRRWIDNSWSAPSTERYLYDENKEIGACNESGTITTLRVLGIGLAADIGAAIAIEIDNTNYTPIHNHRGSVCCLVNASTNTATEISRFTAFGEETLYSENSTPINPWRYSSKRHDEESGLVYFGHRYYSPQQGRWITTDPLGTPDGPNRYAFTKNNPISHLDLFGLYSWSNFLDDFVSTLSSCFDTIVSITSRIFGALRSEAEYLSKMRPTMTSIFEKYFGTGFLTLSGFYFHPMETGNYGQGEINDNIRITFINGILNVRSTFRETLELMSQAHGGTNIHFIFRPTDGWCWDMMKALLVKFGYVSPYARELASTWKSLIQQMGGVEGGGTIIHYCHSLGGVDTVNAASLLTPEERQMIHVISLGSATQIHSDVGFYSATNYVSIRDAVPYTDPIGYIQGIFSSHSNTIFAGSFLDGFPLIDHQLNSATYTQVITNLGYKFLEMYSFY